MALQDAKKKNPAAVALGRKGGKRGGPARAAKLTGEQRSEIARKAVQARWSNAREGRDHGVVESANMGIKKSSEFRKQINDAAPAAVAVDTSDNALLALLKRLKATNDPSEVRQLANQLERVIFHRQFKSA